MKVDLGNAEDANPKQRYMESRDGTKIKIGVKGTDKKIVPRPFGNSYRTPKV